MEAGCAPVGFHGPLGVRGGGGLLEGTLTKTELAIIVQIPLLGVSVLPLVFPGWWDFRCWGDNTGQMPHPLSFNQDQLRVLLYKSTGIKCVGRGGCTELWCLVGIWGPTRASTTGPLGASPPWWSAAW